eukprot:1193306-Prorocentrum_minimum.AAC.4
MKPSRRLCRAGEGRSPWVGRASAAGGSVEVRPPLPRRAHLVRGHHRGFVGVQPGRGGHVRPDGPRGGRHARRRARRAGGRGARARAAARAAPEGPAARVRRHARRAAADGRRRRAAGARRTRSSIKTITNMFHRN